MTRLPTDPAVLVEHLDKTFPTAYGYSAWLKYHGRAPRRAALSDVSFGVARGELFGLLGENGAGKSTVLRLLAGLVAPDGGRVVVNGADARAEPRRMRAHIGLCTGEERSFYFRLTARQNLEYFGELSGVPSRAIQARIRDAARAVDLEADLDRRFDRFSAGMRQRLAVARALLADAEILLLDEPTRAVDPVHAQQLRALIRDELVGRRGKTIVLATNLLEEAWDLCDRVAVLHAGRIVAVASPHDLSGSALPGNVYAIEVDRFDDELLARMNVVEGLLRVTPSAIAAGFSLRVEMGDDPRTFTNLLRAVSANGISVLAIRPQTVRPVDVFTSLTGAAADAD